MNLAINGRFLTQRITGVQRYATEVTRRLEQADDHAITVYCPRHDEPQAHLKRPPKTLGRLKGHLWEQLELAPQVNRQGQLLWSPCNVGPVWAKRHVVTIHDVFSIQRPEWVSSAFHRWYSFLLPRLAKASTHIITVSDYAKDTILEALPVAADKVSVVHNGINTVFEHISEEAIQQVRRKYALPDSFILILGSLEPRKNLLRVVTAWSQLPESHKLPLMIAGGLGKKEVFGDFDLDSLLTDKSVKMLGYIPDEDLPALYSSATLFVYASLEEGFGLPPLEAIACGASVVTSDTSSMKEMCTGLATLVDPLDVASIAEGMIHALAHQEDLPTRLARAQETKARYNWEETTAKVRDILRRYES